MLRLGLFSREKGALWVQRWRGGHHQPALAMLPPRRGSPRAPWSKLNFSCPSLPDADLNRLGRLAHEKGEIFALKDVAQ